MTPVPAAAASSTKSAMVSRADISGFERPNIAAIVAAVSYRVSRRRGKDTSATNDKKGKMTPAAGDISHHADTWFSSILMATHHIMTRNKRR
jgi:hypothetical protein